jgi:hypothetical protein
MNTIKAGIGQSKKDQEVKFEDLSKVRAEN